jgi:hypothetical protein
MIIFSTLIDHDVLRMAYNNDVVRFYSNSTLPVAYATVSIPGFSATLYPAPNGSFYFNFKPYVSALINTRNFEDTLQTDLQSLTTESFVYNATAGTLLNADAVFTIYFNDETADTTTLPLTWLAGAEQLGNYNPRSKLANHILSPYRKGTANAHYLKYWQGYPFDVSVYSPHENILVTNQTNLLNAAFVVPGQVFRMVLSNGDDDETLEDVLPLVEGFNTLRVKHLAEDSDSDTFISLEKVPYKNGVYLKWLNTLGGYSYWLFEDTYSIDRSTKSVGEIDRDFSNLNDTFGRTAQVGKESQDTLKIIAELLTEDERAIAEGILDSPKIYLFTGRPFARNGYRDWVEVSLKTTSARIKNPRQPLTNFTFDIELPVRFTQTL